MYTTASHISEKIEYIRLVVMMYVMQLIIITIDYNNNPNRNMRLEE